MNRIDTTNWKEFRIGDLFEQERGKESSPSKVPNGKYPLITETNVNNGFVKNSDGTKLFKGNAITVSVNFAETVFYQKNNFYASINILILRHPKLNELSGLFIAGILSKRHKGKYNYSHKISKEKLNNESIKLPVHKTYQPDWELLETLINMITVGGGYYDMSNIDTSSWKEFKLSDIGFLNYHGSRLTKADRVPGNIVFLTAGKENQGVACKIGNDVQLYKDVITIDMFGNCFYHDEECAGDDNIYFFVNDNISKRIKLFLVSCLTKKLQQKYSYGHQFRQIDADALTIKLPYKEVEEPDWQFMENYISQLEAERISQLEAYLKVTGLDDYELTDEDREVLSREVEMREFALGDIFEKKTVKGIPKKNENLTERIEGYHIFGQNIKYQHPQKILADEKYLQKVNAKYPILAYTSSVGEIGMIEESFYRSGDNGAFQGLFPKCKIELLPMHYILTILKKQFNSFDYSTSMQKIMDLNLLLPIISHPFPSHTYTIEDIDFDYMEKYIRAIEKQTIAHVYESKGKIIEKTKEIVENRNE